MKNRVYWGIGILIILLIGGSVFILLRNTDTEPEKVYIDVDPSKDVMNSLHIQTLKSNLPATEDGYKWVWHHDHWDKIPVSEKIKTPIIANNASMNKPTAQIGSVVVNGISDLKEYLDYFESFSDDPSWEEFRNSNFSEMVIQYGISMRGFDYKNASPEVKILDKQISDKITSLSYIYSDKNSIALKESEAYRRSLITPEMLERIGKPFIARPDVNEGGNE